MHLSCFCQKIALAGSLHATARGAPLQDLARSSDQSRHSATHSQAGDEPGLNEGAFDEAESHRSFMEALNEWRAGNRAQSAAGQQQQQQQQPQQCAGEEQALPQAERPQLQPPKYGLRQLKQQAGGPAAGQADAGVRRVFKVCELVHMHAWCVRMCVC